MQETISVKQIIENSNDANLHKKKQRQPHVLTLLFIYINIFLFLSLLSDLTATGVTWLFYFLNIHFLFISLLIGGFPLISVILFWA